MPFEKPGPPIRPEVPIRTQEAFDLGSPFEEVEQSGGQVAGGTLGAGAAVEFPVYVVLF